MTSSQSKESESTAAKSKPRSSCIYRVLYPLCVSNTGQWLPKGVIADLADLEDVQIQYLLRVHLIETADPTAEQPVFNKPLGKVERKPCPCGK